MVYTIVWVKGWRISFIHSFVCLFFQQTSIGHFHEPGSVLGVHRWRGHPEGRERTDPGTDYLIITNFLPDMQKEAVK